MRGNEPQQETSETMPLNDRIDGPIYSCLRKSFGEKWVIPEWAVCKKLEGVIEPDDLKKIRYCPRVDFGIGPFNTDKDQRKMKQNLEDISSKHSDHREFIKYLSDLDSRCEKTTRLANGNEDRETISSELTNFQFDDNTNKNPRCFMAIEVENVTSQKHRMGSIVNASALGKVGLIVAKTKKAYRGLIRIRMYLRLLLAVGKPAIPIRNCIILPKRDLVRVASRYHRQNH